MSLKYESMRLKYESMSLKGLPLWAGDYGDGVGALGKDTVILLYSRYRSLSLRLSDTRVYEPQIRALLRTTVIAASRLRTFKRCSEKLAGETTKYGKRVTSLPGERIYTFRVRLYTSHVCDIYILMCATFSCARRAGGDHQGVEGGGDRRVPRDAARPGHFSIHKSMSLKYEPSSDHRT